jgi:hypothetical protein
MATIATVGQRTLEISPQEAAAGAMAVVVVRSKTTGKAVRYTVPESWIGRLIEINRKNDPAGRYEEVMKADGLFEVAPEPQGRAEIAYTASDAVRPVGLGRAPQHVGSWQKLTLRR